MSLKDLITYKPGTPDVGPIGHILLILTGVGIGVVAAVKFYYSPSPVDVSGMAMLAATFITVGTGGMVANNYSQRPKFPEEQKPVE